MPVRIRSRRGVTREEAIELVPEARAIAARFPGDAAVLTALAEAEVDSGNPDAAITAADAALAIDPRQVNAYIQKGLALFEKAETAQDKAKAYRDARAAFLKLNQIENDHPLPLMYFYMSYLRQGAVPGENAVKALARASELAPFDLGLRYTLVVQQIRDKRYEDAAFNLAPIAFNPHGRTHKARRLLDRLKEKTEITPLELDALLASDQAEGDEPAAGN
jgi:tetratricopeptide (TPR) repeat protein